MFLYNIETSLDELSLRLLFLPTVFQLYRILDRPRQQVNYRAFI